MTTLARRPLSVPVILSRSRHGPPNKPVASFAFADLLQREHVESVLIDHAAKLFDAAGRLLDDAHVRRVGKFFAELTGWRARFAAEARSSAPNE